MELGEVRATFCSWRYFRSRNAALLTAILQSITKCGNNAPTVATATRVPREVAVSGKSRLLLLGFFGVSDGGVAGGCLVVYLVA